VSHFILRLAYCRSADLRQWLLAQESLLFKCRFKELGAEEQVGGVYAREDKGIMKGNKSSKGWIYIECNFPQKILHFLHL
jgi:hypothetical protein